MTSSSSFGASVITLQFNSGREHRRGRAGGAGGDQCGADLPAQRSADAADLQQGQSCRRAHPDAGNDLRQHAAAAGGGPGGHDLRAEDFAAAGRRTGQHQRRTEAGSPHPGESDGAGLLRHEPGAVALGDRAGQRRPGQGTTAGQPAVLHHRRQRSVAEPAGLRRHHRRLQERQSGAALRCRQRRHGRGERQPGGVDEQHAGGDSEHSAAAGRQHHQGRRQHQAAAEAAAVEPAGLGEGHGADRPHQHHSRQRQGCAVRDDADHRAGGDGDLPLPAHPGGDRSSPASPCRFRWSAPSA